MTPKKPKSELELYQSHLQQILDHEHPLFKLSHQIDWKYFEAEFGPLYHPEKAGRACRSELLPLSWYAASPIHSLTPR